MPQLKYKIELTVARPGNLRAYVMQSVSTAKTATSHLLKKSRFGIIKINISVSG